MKAKHLKQKAAPKSSGSQKTFSDLLRSARRNSAYVFAASLGVWLPKAEAATLVNLDSTALPLGEASTWANTGSLVGDFVTGSGATTNPTVVLVDGVKGMSFQADGGTAGAGSHYVGPIAPSSIAGANARTIEAWIFNDSSQDAEAIVGWGRRGGDGLNNYLGHGIHTAWGGAEMWGAPDLGWGNTAAAVATNVVFNRWTYIVQSFDGTNNNLYVDGRLANSEGRPATAQINTAELDEGGNPIPIRVAREIDGGGGVSGASVGNFVAGRIRIHDTALSSGAISSQFALEKGDFNLNDTDGDGMPDWWEVRYGLDKNSNADAATDADSDGLLNLAEFQRGTSPTDTDSDDDGATDGAEVNRLDGGNPAPTNPTDSDSDDDTLLDGVETDTGTFVSASNTGSDPLKGDTDGDIVSDGAEVACGTDPNNAATFCSIARAIELDATGLTAGTLLTNWINTGFIAGNFVVPATATVPAVTAREGINGVALQAAPAGAGGTHYFGPATIPEVAGTHPRTVEAWVYDTVPQGEKVIVAWGGRNTGNGSNYPFGLGTDNAWGAVGAWGEPDIGWNDLEVRGRWTHVATTYDGSSTRLFVEGVLVNSETYPTPGGQAINTLLNAPTDGQPYHFRIGRQNGNTTFDSVDNTGEGAITIARVRVYTNALDAATIKARFDSEKTFFGLADQDGDGMPTWYELRSGLDPNDATGINGASGDLDGDGLTNIQEYNLGTLANDADTDDDGSNDRAETIRVDAGLPAPPTGAVAPSNPVNADTDGDGLRDGVETDTGVFASSVNTGSDPLVADTDGDGFVDGLEVSQGSSPVNPLEVPSPNPRIELIATNLPAGPLTEWINSGNFSNGMAFVAGNGGGTVQSVQGVTALRLPVTGGGYYTGPTNPAVANLTGNPVYSIEAWIHNESPGQGEEIILGWGRRGTDGLNNAFGHGTSGDFGAMGHWGARDLGWNGVVNYDRWTHLVYTYDAATSIQRAYVDGAQVNQETIAGLSIADVGTAGPAPIRVGRQNAASGAISGVGPAAGLSIGELRVYSRVLPPAEITTKFNATGSLYGIFDTDGDGMPSWFERKYPTCLNENNQADGTGDCDSDGLSNANEFTAGTDPLIADTDGDGLSDGAEVNVNSTNPTNPDTDYDGLRDAREIALGTVPVGLGSQDSDGDSFSDSTEVVYGSDPLSIASVPDTTTPKPFVTLDATALPLGPLPVWTNNNALGWVFSAPTGAVASVEVVDGTKGVSFNQTNHYAGPNTPNFFAGNASRAVEAWIWNPSPRSEQETVFAWGRRGGPDGSNASFIHGFQDVFGAMGFWGPGPDMPWGTNATQIAQNVPTNAWTHVAYTYDSATSNKVVYVNGAYANSETNPNVLNTHFFDPSDPLNTGATPFGRGLVFRVGAQSDASGAFATDALTRPTMAIARVKAYDVALTAAQIAANYNAERVAFPGQPRITNVKVQPNGFVSFDWVPTPGRTYEVQRNDSLDNANGWSPVGTGLNSGSFTNDPGTSPKYYRMRVEPLP